MEKLKTISLNNLNWRENPIPADISGIREIIASSGFFSLEELEVAIELVEERLRMGVGSGYHFFFIEEDGRLIAYSCFGPIPGTLESYDIYWIAVRNEVRGMGLGSLILKTTERKIKSMGGSRVYIETSSREQYLPTRSFYEAGGYTGEAFLKDFYSPGDGKIIYVKVV